MYVEEKYIIRKMHVEEKEEKSDVYGESDVLEETSDVNGESDVLEEKSDVYGESDVLEEKSNVYRESDVLEYKLDGDISEEDNFDEVVMDSDIFTVESDSD